MKKSHLLLSAVLLISLLAGCDELQTAESNSSISSAVDSMPAISTTDTDKTTTQISSSENSIPTQAEDTSSQAIDTTTTNKSTAQNSATQKTHKPTTQKTKTTTENKTTITTTQKTSSTQNSKTTTETKTTTKQTTTTTKKPEVSTTTTTTTTTSKTTTTTTNKTKPNHGTPNITGKFYFDYANEVLTYVNAARQAAGLSALQMDNGNMMVAAKIRALEITEKFAHERPDGAPLQTVFSEENVTDFSAAGENLAYGQRTAKEVFDAWMNSEGHKANIMEPKFTHISIVSFEYNNRIYWVQLFKQAKHKK